MTDAKVPSSGVSTRELREICQKGKGEIFFFSKYIYRPITIHLTRLYAALRLSPTACTVHSHLAALGAATVLLWPSPLTFLAAAVLIQLYFLLDHVDGELARLYAWLGVRPLKRSGEYLDFWVHFHSVNLAFATLGIGMSLHSGSILWAVVGLLLCNSLGNFPKFVLSRILLAASVREPELRGDSRMLDLVRVATDQDNKELFKGSLTTRLKLFFLARELLIFPGCLIALPASLVIDAAIGILKEQTAFAVTGIYMLVFVTVAVASKLRRTAWSMRRLDRLDEDRL